ncbi:MFS transporter [Cnuibacter physcomitrellae]|uniref:MFS transporter n=1 Tax=Cnuibacter physcomitrellae TaxID=1619308 RepID=A0A1X9LF46_9MICO|nr:MFS transporter [Cnuibacter physcomitrellae]ARJ03826.1 MFS transporter [Cnuibacter physcomitrellae]GGI39590.1 MFS transporter [Cnuibacter physcomitrellae]
MSGATDSTGGVAGGTGTGAASRPAAGTAPARGPLVLLALILAAGVANLNLSVANVALPSIGAAFDASQSALNLVAVGFSLGLAGSVLYLGALGDRYGRKLMLVLGLVLSIPACLLAAFAPSVDVLFLARILGGVAAGMAYPTTLSLIAALWTGPKRIAAIALWSGLGGAISALGPLASGWLIGMFDWPSVFFMTLPLCVVTLVLVLVLVPAKVNETTEAVDHLGGVLSTVMVASLVLGINFAAVPGQGTTALVLGVIAVVAGVAFVLRQRRARNPLYDLRIASRRTFWVAAVGGIIVFGSLMGAMYIGQLFLQNVLGYSAFQSGASILPAAAVMVLAAPLSSRLVLRFGARTVFLLGFAACLLGFLTMYVFWDVGISYAPVAVGYALIGLGVGLAGPPSSRSLTDSVPVFRAGMASGTSDLQRDLGGSIMQSVLGSILTAGYASAIAKSVASAPADVQSEVTSGIQAQLQKSFDGAISIAKQYPQYQDQIVQAARESFLSGADWAYATGIIAMVIGALVVVLFYPRKDEEHRLLREYATEYEKQPEKR